MNSLATRGRARTALRRQSHISNWCRGAESRVGDNEQGFESMQRIAPVRPEISPVLAPRSVAPQLLCRQLID
jgi:hypothetical protein